MSFAAFETSRYQGAPVSLYLFSGSGEGIGPFAYTNGSTSIIRDGITYAPRPIKHGDIQASGNLDKKTLDITMARGSDLDALFLAFPPSQVINVSIFRGHVGDVVSTTTYPAEWHGQARGAAYDDDNELTLQCEPLSVSMKRPGLRRNYQLGCPLDLYGEQCRASKVAATTSRTVLSVSGRNVTITSALSSTRGVEAYLGGIVQWNRPDGVLEMASMTAIDAGGSTFSMRGALRGIQTGTTLEVSLGCNRTMDHCIALHNNIFNFGGQPNIPLENPMSSTSIFY